MNRIKTAQNTKVESFGTEYCTFIRRTETNKNAQLQK